MAAPEIPSDPTVEKVYIREAAGELNRRMGTLRKWEQAGILPLDLLPKRGARGWRYWTRPQLEALKAWVRDTDRRSGKGLPHYNPTEAELDKAIAAMRVKRKTGPKHFGTRV